MSRSKGTEIGIGFVLVFLLLGVATYFIAGMTFRYRRGMRRCPEILPHYRIWTRICAKFCPCCCSLSGFRKGQLEGKSSAAHNKNKTGHDDVEYNLDGAFSSIPADPNTLEEFDDEEDEMIGAAQV